LKGIKKARFTQQLAWDTLAVRYRPLREVALHCIPANDHLRLERGIAAKVLERPLEGRWGNNSRPQARLVVLVENACVVVGGSIATERHQK